MVLGNAYERGLQEVHRTWARDVLGPRKMKVLTLRFSVIERKIDGRFLQLQNW